jgi:hypothetical protein
MEKGNMKETDAPTNVEIPNESGQEKSQGKELEAAISHETPPTILTFITTSTHL